jgi:hypothetical protein
MEPLVIQIRVEGTYVDGNEPFVAKLAITRDGIHTAYKHLPQDVSVEEKKFRFKRDVHRQPMKLKLQCKGICSRRARPLVAADIETSEPKEPQNH